jgi:hypothetical protein
VAFNTKGTSFGTVSATRRRLIMAIDGLEKQGKTHFALTAPKPCAILNFDIGLEGVVQKFDDGKGYYPANYFAEAQANAQATADKANAVWSQLMTDYQWALKNCRTIVADTASETWETLRLARFGKLTQVMPHHYGPVNAEFRKLIRMAYDHDCNLILLHKLKSVYENKVNSQGKEVSNKIPGAFARQGMGDTGFLVQLNAVAYRGDVESPPVPQNDYYTNISPLATGDFNLYIRDCRQNAELAGQVIPQALLTFSEVAQMILPDTSAKDWE